MVHITDVQVTGQNRLAIRYSLCLLITSLLLLPNVLPRSIA